MKTGNNKVGLNPNGQSPRPVVRVSIEENNSRDSSLRGRLFSCYEGLSNCLSHLFSSCGGSTRNHIEQTGESERLLTEHDAHSSVLSSEQSSLGVTQRTEDPISIPSSVSISSPPYAHALSPHPTFAEASSISARPPSPIEYKHTAGHVTEIKQIIEQQQAIFSNPNITPETLQKLNHLQSEFEKIISNSLSNEKPIMELQKHQELWQALIEGKKAIKFAENFPRDLKTHVLCTFARLIMIKEGAELVKLIMKGPKEIFFKIGAGFEQGMNAEPVNITQAKVKDVRYDKDSESSGSESGSTYSFTPDNDSDGSNLEEQPPEITEPVGISMKPLFFRGNNAFQRLPEKIKSEMNTYEQRKPIRRDYYPVKANKGDDSIITIQQRINDGDFLVGGRDRTKRFLEVLSPSFIILGHELIHCLHNQWGINLREVQKSVFNVGKFINSFTNLLSLTVT